MANKAISELPQALNVNNQDLFVLEQSGIAKKLTAETFITEQGIIDALAEALDGHGGIQSVTLSSVSGRIRTYLITFTDGTSTTFQVLDGTSIDRITKTSTAGLVDTYTVFMNDGTTTFFTVTNGADGNVSEAMLNDALKDKAPAITETTESSAIANFTDGADDMVMHNVIAEINPIQSGSGDPSPSNIRPITGWTGATVTRTGKNLIDIADKTMASEGYLFNQSFDFPSGQYALSYTSTTPTNRGAVVAVGRDGNNCSTVLSTQGNKIVCIISAPNGIASMRVYNGAASYSEIQLELGSTATTYEPYIAPTTVSLSWQTEAGTVYGGTIDVATGLLTVNMAIVDMGTLTWALYGSGETAFFFSTSDIGVRPATTNAISSMFPLGNIAVTNTTNNVFSITGNPYVRVRCLDYSDANAFKTAMSGVQLCYELATPQTYQLTPQEVKTLLGTNNVWADTGNVTVKYPADTKMFIEKLTMPTEDDLVANQAITSGKYFMIGNSLYLALANIASGAQITIGTNAQRVSLADALNTINS